MHADTRMMAPPVDSPRQHQARIPRRLRFRWPMPRKFAKLTRKQWGLAQAIGALFFVTCLILLFWPHPRRVDTTITTTTSLTLPPKPVCRAHRSDPNGVACRPQDNRPPYPHMYDSPPPMETVQRRPSGAETRSALLTVATAINEDTCAHWMSALLSGFDVCTAGVGRSSYGHLDKFALVKEAIDAKELRDWDVIFYADQDAIYTGQDIQPFVDEFIRRSPEHPDDINVRKIRRGEAVAPLRFMAEPWCTAIYTLGDREPCTSRFDDLDAAVERVAERDQFQYLPGVNSTHGDGNTRFMNAGVFMARVWAIKELLRATPRYTKFFPFPGALQKCDQSIYTALYLDQRFEEAEFGLLAPQGHLANISRINQFGLHYGLIDIWQENRAATLAMNFPPALHQVDGRAYGVNQAYPALSQIGSTEDRTAQAAALFREARDPAFFVEQRRLRYTHPLGVQSIPIAPPLLSLAPRPMDVESNTPDEIVPVIPALLHFADSHKSIRIVDNFPLTGWRIAMELVPGQKRRSVEILRTAVAEVLTESGTIEYYALSKYCYPWITQYIGNGRDINR